MEEKLLTYEDIVKLLGVAKITLYGWVCRAKIPFLKINGLVRFRQSDIDAWIESCKREAGERREKKPTRRGRPRKLKRLCMREINTPEPMARRTGR